MIKTKILSLALNSTMIIQAVWVFDNFVVARLTNGRILFFEKPLILGSTVSAFNQTSAPGLSNPVTFNTFEMGRDESDSSKVFFYGVS